MRVPRSGHEEMKSKKIIPLAYLGAFINMQHALLDTPVDPVPAPEGAG